MWQKGIRCCCKGRVQPGSLSGRSGNLGALGKIRRGHIVKSKSHPLCHDDMTKQRRHSTLSEVAKEAGVGTTTVSRVINGGLGVDPNTLERVQKAIRMLGYMPNQAARILKGDRTRTIGFVIPSIADPFFASCAEAAQAIARKNDSLLIVLTTQNDIRAELEAVHVLMRHRVDGFVIAPSNPDSTELRELVRRSPVPAVALDRPILGAEVSSVLADSFHGAQTAVRHLIGHGYKRIACLTGEPELYTIRERLRAYSETMEAAGMDSLIDTSVVDHGSAELALDRLFRRKKAPHAIFTLKNSTTIDTFEMLQKHKIVVPKKVALLGYDDFQLAETVRPSISVIQQPIAEMGHRAAELLFEKLLATKDGAGPLPHHVLLKTTLIARGSCGCHPDD